MYLLDSNIRFILYKYNIDLPRAVFSIHLEQNVASHLYSICAKCHRRENLEEVNLKSVLRVFTYL